MSGHTYYLRIILNYKSYNDNYQKQSNIIQATVQDYSELCLEEEIARKFVPVLHRHPDDLQPQFLANVDNVVWSSREVFTINGSNAIGRKEFLHEYSTFHWQYRWDWDSWGIGQTFVQYKWNIADSERYKVEKPGERPLYYHVYKSGPYYYVQYWYFLTMNDIRDQVSVYDPWHEGDFEHVAIELEKVDDNFVPRRVNFYMHYGGRQYPANECWWGSDAANELPQLGYDEKHTHLHVWIARNAHASYNYKEALHKFDTIDGSSFVEDVDFTLGYDELTADQAYFYWDYLANLGEIVKSSDSDGNGLPNAHGWNWFDHVEYVPTWQDFQWVPFRVPLGDFWCTSFGVGKTCTAPPNSPPFGIDWFIFSDNEDECGFGNHSRSFLGIDVATIQYIDPDTGAVICERKPK